MKPIMLAVALALISFAISSRSEAAPFCLVSQFGTQCTYQSADACQQATEALGGACIVNQREAAAPSGNAPFCVVTQGRSDCRYSDADYCRQTAATLGGMCAVNPNRSR